MDLSHFTFLHMGKFLYFNKENSNRSKSITAWKLESYFYNNSFVYNGFFLIKKNSEG